MKKFASAEIDISSAAEIVQAIRHKRVTSEQVVRESLERAASAEPILRAWASLNPTAALAQARARDGEAAQGLLHGVPIAVKDLSDTADMATSYGSPAYRNHRPRVDAACVAALRRAGAVILGKTETVEFGASRPCATTNPHNAKHTPGGSSAGSAAAVGGRLLPLATGTQTGGSIIRPASFCGVVGFKPTFGALPVAGTKSYAWSLDTIGGFANSVADAWLLFDALRGLEESSNTGERFSKPRLGLFWGPFTRVAAESAINVLGRLASACSWAGASVEEINPPVAFGNSLEWQRTISRYEMGRSLLPEARAFGAEELRADLYGDIQSGLSVGERDYRQAKAGRAQLVKELDMLFSGFDGILTLSTPGEAPQGLHSTGDATFCLSWSLVGMPTINLPAGTGPQGLPLGVQLVGSRYDDEMLLRIAAWVEGVIANI